MTENFYQAENKIKEKIVFSPSLKFKLVIETFKTKSNCWDYTRGTLFETRTNKIIAQIDRNYCTFHHSWLTINGQEWLQTGRTYMSQIFVNCNNSEIYDCETNNSQFCWAESWIANDQKTLIVLGCFWGGCYEYIAYDFNDFINKKIAPLEMDEIIDCGNTQVLFENDYIIIDEYTNHCMLSVEEKLAKRNKFIRVNNKLILKDIEYYLPECIDMYS